MTVITNHPGLTPAQVRRARALLGWTSYQLAARCEFGQHVITNFEVYGRLVSNRGRLETSRAERLAIMRRVLEEAGIQFSDESDRAASVELRPP